MQEKGLIRMNGVIQPKQQTQPRVRRTVTSADIPEY